MLFAIIVLYTRDFLGREGEREHTRVPNVSLGLAGKPVLYIDGGIFHSLELRVQ